MAKRALSVSTDDPCDALADVSADEFAAARTTLSLRPESTLRVCTWNIWFDRQDMSERLILLVRQMLREAPDYVGLQEVTSHVENALRGSAALLELYDISPLPVERYGCLILARRSLGATFDEVELPTMMGRSLLIARSAGFTFATVHLESLNNAPTRRAQLEVAAQALASHGDANQVLCGDFNFDSVQEWGDWRTSRSRTAAELENSCLGVLLPRFTDAWAALHPDERGITFDGACNPYVREPREIMRYDRVLVSGAELVGATLLGVLHTKPHWSTREAMTPSDHYGVIVDLRLAGAQ